MNSLFSILKKHVDERPVLRSARSVLTVEEVNEILKTIFGDTAIEFMQASYIKNNILFIKCNSSVVANEMILKESYILAKIKEKNFSTEILKIKTII